MKWFYHHERDSVGVCKSCGKAVCVDCAVDLGRGLACKDRCERDVEAAIALADQNAKAAHPLNKEQAVLRKIFMALFIVLAAVWVFVGRSVAIDGLSLGTSLMFVAVIFLLHQPLPVPTRRPRSTRR